MAHRRKHETGTDQERSPGPPPLEPDNDNNPAFSERPKDAYGGKPDQDVTANTGAGSAGQKRSAGSRRDRSTRESGDTCRAARRFVVRAIDGDNLFGAAGP